MISARWGTLRTRLPAALAAAGAIGMFAPGATAGGSLIKVGEGGSPLPGVPAVKVEVPSPGGAAPLAEVGVSEKGITAATPVTPAVEVPVPKVEVPVGTVTTPVTPPSVETIGAPTGAVTGSGGSGGGGSGGGSGSGSGSGPGSGPAPSTASAAGVSAGVAGTAAVKTAATHAGTAKSGGNSGHVGGGGAGGPSGSGAATGALAAVRGPVGSTGAAGASGTRTPARRAAHAASDPLSSLGRNLPVPLPVPDWSKPIILLLALLAIGFGVRWRLATRRARRLERRQGTLLRDIEAMQAALVPEVPERLGGLGLSVAYRPAEGPAAGGDFYDAFAIGNDGVAVILGDVAGHGHDALRQAALTRYTLRAFLKETCDPRAALALAGHALSEPGMEQLATVAIAMFDAKRGTLTYALAGHPPPLLVGVPVEDAPMACSSPPLGCEIATGRRQRTIGMPEGSRVCFFSDGLIEARRSVSPPSGHPDLLGRERLAELLAELPPGAGAAQLVAAVREDAAATPDDMAACILTCEARGARRLLDLEELEVDRHASEAGHLAVYLRSSGLSEADASRALRAVDAQLEGHDTAVLLVDRSGGGDVEVGVRAGGERLSGAAELRRVEPGATRLMRA